MTFPLELLPLQKLLLRLARCVLAGAVSSFTLFERAHGHPETEFSRDSAVSESRPCASLVQVPVHFAIGSIKERLPVIKYSNCLERPEGHRWDDDSSTALCAVCLALVNASDEVRELCNCSHVFHTECLDGWIDRGRTTCPLCRSRLWPDLNHGKSKGSSGDPWRRERMIYLFGED